MGEGRVQMGEWEQWGMVSVPGHVGGCGGLTGTAVGGLGAARGFPGCWQGVSGKALLTRAARGRRGVGNRIRVTARVEEGSGTYTGVEGKPSRGGWGARALVPDKVAAVLKVTVVRAMAAPTTMGAVGRWEATTRAGAEVRERGRRKGRKPTGLRVCGSHVMHHVTHPTHGLHHAISARTMSGIGDSGLGPAYRAVPGREPAYVL
jgi:hypothetical protein